MLARVLGALEIVGAQGPIGVGGPVPRRILTALLAQTGTTVSLDALVDAAWGDDRPASAERTVQSHITRLREALSSLDPAPSLERRPGGYVLAAEPDDIDAVRFEHLVSAARECGPAAAVGLLREALGLWRSATPYADLQDTAYPEAQAARLVEMRGVAADSLALALLKAGDPAAAAAESEARLREDPYRESLWETLVVALYRQGRQADALSAYQRARRTLDDGLGIEPGPRLRSIEAQVLAQDPALLDRSSAPARHPCPYKGLARYDEADADLYVGRERLIEELLARLVDSGLLVVVGPSGAGKSSLVRAGLVPALAHGGLPGSESWVVRVIVPGTVPVAALDHATRDHPQLLVVDQAEEGLLADDGAHVKEFGDRVLAAVDDGTRVVLALRADFYGRLAEHPALARRVGPASVLVAPPDDDELQRIVAEPAARVGLRVEPALAELVVAEVRGRAGVLPVLSTALVRTWEHRDGDLLTVESYRRGGGVVAALQRVGEEAWTALENDGQRAACRRLLLRLAVFEDGQWVRRRARRAEVTAQGDVAAAAALAVLADRRLVVAGTHDVEIAHEALLTGWPRLLGWLEDGRAHAEVRDRLTVAATEWDEGGRDPSELYAGTRLQAALDTQAASPDDVSPLELEFLDQSRLATDRALVEQRERADREARGRRRTRAVAAGLAAALLLAAVAGGAALHQRGQAEEAASTAESAAVSSDAGRLGAIARTGGEYDLALLYAAQAVRLHPSAQAESDLFATLERGDAVTSVSRTPGLVRALAYSPDGSTLAGVTLDGNLSLWPARGGTASSTIGQAAATVDLDANAYTRNVAWVNDRTVVAGTADGPALLDPRTGSILSQGPGLAGLWSMSRDGRQVVSLDDDGNGGAASHVLVWQVGSPASQARRVDLGAPAGAALTCGDDACVLAWDQTLTRIRYRDGARLAVVSLPASSDVGYAAMSRDGTMLAVADADGLVRVIDPRSGRIVRTLSGGSSDWQPLAFSEDGRRLAVRDFDSVVVWDTAGDASPQRLQGHVGRVSAAAFSPDGATLAAAADDRTLITWDVSGTHGLAPVLTEKLPAAATTLWATSTYAVLGEDDGTVRLVDLRTGEVGAMSGGAPHLGRTILTARTGADGGPLLVTADSSGRTAVWDLGRRALVGAVPLPPPDDRHGPDTWVSPDGRLAATIRTGDGPMVIDLATRSVARQLPPLPSSEKEDAYTVVQGWSPDGHDIYLTRVQFGGNELLSIDSVTGAVRMRTTLAGDTPNEVAPDPQGRFLALAMGSGWVLFVDPRTGRPLAPPTSSITGSVYNVSVSRDGRYVSATGSTAQLTLWDTTTFREVGAPLSFLLGSDARARFSPDGRVVVSNGTSVRTLEVDAGAWLARACRLAGRSLTRDEWAEVLPNRPYDPACGASDAAPATRGAGPSSGAASP